MRTKKNIRAILVAASMMAFGHSNGQVSTPFNSGGPGDYVGWDAGTLQNLDIKHKGNFPIDFYTDATRRMRLQETATYGIGSFPNQSKYGSLLLCPKVDGFYTNGAKGPFSLLHLAADDHNAQQASYRPWMNVGINFTGNNDQDYIGQKARDLDYTDMVAHWSDNPGEDLKDRFRFIFTSGYNAHATTGAQSKEGLEFMRMWAAKYDDPRIDIGDWYAAHLADPLNVTEPTERLDIVDGRVRIRQLPDDPEVDHPYRVMVVDNSDVPSAERGVVKWIDPSNITGITSCSSGWSLTGTNTSTAYNGNPCPPQDADAVSIGLGLSGSAPAKLNVTNNSTTASMLDGVKVDVNKTGLANDLVVNATSGTQPVYGIDATDFPFCRVSASGPIPIGPCG